VGDTHPDVRARQVAAWRALSPTARAALAVELTEVVGALAEQGIRHDEPGLSDAKVRRELIRRRYGSALAEAVVIPDP